jgi:hypothetical protein
LQGERGVGKLSADEVLQNTGGKAGQFTETQPDGSKITYFVEEEEESDYEVTEYEITTTTTKIIGEETRIIMDRIINEL